MFRCVFSELTLTAVCGRQKWTWEDWLGSFHGTLQRCDEKVGEKIDSRDIQELESTWSD